MKVDCRMCENWYDEGFDGCDHTDGTKRSFYGCRVFGPVENFREMIDCPEFVARQEPYHLCQSCNLPVPRVCLLLGECVNCTDTDLFCLEHCVGGEWKKYCTHWVRLNTEGRHVVEDDTPRDVFPADAPPQKQKPSRRLRKTYRSYLDRQKRQGDS